MKKIMILISLIFLIIDQIIKIIVTTFLPMNKSIVIIPDFFKLTYVQNKGAAWSMFSGNILFLVFITFLTIIFIYHLFIKDKELDKKETIIFGILIGGILGNLIDRICRNYVVDYFDFNIFGYDFPIFNLADIAIVCMMITVIFLKRKE